MTVEMSRTDSRRSPLVSVVIPAYNCSSYIREALESVFANTFTDHEIIVINDGSSDTAELERALERYRPQIIYLPIPNGGPSAARNAGISIAQGRFIAFLDCDDVWHPEFLARQIESLERDALDLVCSDMVMFGPNLGEEYRFMSVTPCSPPTVENLLADK